MIKQIGDETQRDYDQYIKELTDLIGEALEDLEEGRVVSSDEFKERLKQKKDKLDKGDK